MCVFQWKTGHILEMARYTAKLLITNRNCHTPCQIRWKSLTLDDLEGHGQTVQSSFLVTAELHYYMLNFWPFDDEN